MASRDISRSYDASNNLCTPPPIIVKQPKTKHDSPMIGVNLVEIKELRSNIKNVCRFDFIYSTKGPKIPLNYENWYKTTLHLPVGL